MSKIQLSPKDTIPLFTTHYSLHQSILTLEEAGKSKEGNPISICDIAKNNKLEHVTIVDERIDGFIEAYKNIQKSGISQLIYGLKMVVVPDMTEKTPESLDAESKVIIFIKNSQGYNDLIKIWNRAWTDGLYYQGRADWKLLKEYWTENLILVLPFFSSFLAKNQLTLNHVVPDLHTQPIIFWEMNSGLPFESIIKKSIEKFIDDKPDYKIMPTKQIYYHKKSDFDTYICLRAVETRATYSAPRADHLFSNNFSFEDWMKLCQ